MKIVNETSMEDEPPPVLNEYRAPPSEISVFYIYSKVSNKHVGWNKRAGRKIFWKFLRSRFG